MTCLVKTLLVLTGFRASLGLPLTFFNEMYTHSCNTNDAICVKVYLFDKVYLTHKEKYVFTTLFMFYLQNYKVLYIMNWV